MLVPWFSPVRYIMLMVVLALVAVGCSAAGTATPVPIEEAPMDAQRPDTSASSVLEHLQTVDYQETWDP